MRFIQTVLMLMALTGSFLNAKKLKICFILWIICNIGWAIIDIKVGMFPRFVQDLFQLGFTVYGWVYWNKTEQIDKQ